MIFIIVQFYLTFGDSIHIKPQFYKLYIKAKENVQGKIRSMDEDVINGNNSKMSNELDWQPNKELKDTLKDMFHY